jgi:hypothetical protein
MWDVFISHASEDKETVARPLAVELEAKGLQVWLDSQELYIGDQLTPKIEQGLQNAQFGVVIFSRSFFAKKWTQLELESLLKMEKPPDKVILPVWHELTTAEVEEFSPTLAAKIGVETMAGLDQVVIALLRAIRRTRNQPLDHWLTFAKSGMPDEAAIKSWLQAGEAELSRPSVAWPTEILTVAADLKRRRLPLQSLKEIQGKPGWCLYEGQELRKSVEVEALLRLPFEFDRWNALLPVRLVHLANGLKDYGKGYQFAQNPVRNFMFLWFRFIWKQILRAQGYLGLPHPRGTDYLDDIRDLKLSGPKELASAHVMYTHQPNHWDPLNRSLKGFRMWAPRGAIEKSRNTDQWYVDWEALEEFFVPQLEERMMLEFDSTAITYTSHRERWHLSSFKDENGDPL